uniref:neuroblast differentiation-associated protein AHNAK n=1 Tax=Gasterosteus aculeatus aculeatus TaxID=481459 RepID=UPI001A98E49E|nr:neuroblast differentiation-associated protein AHNAK [Gasterosteus aculeatus aculeatus]
MSGDSKSRLFSESLVLDDSEEGDDKMAARSGLQAGDEIVAATIHLDHFNQGEVLKILKVLEPYDKNMVFLTKKQLGASADLGSFGLVRNDSGKMLNFKKDLSLDASLDGLSGKLNASQGLGGEIGGPTLNGDLPSLSLSKPSADASAKFPMPSLGLNGPDIKGDLDGTLKAPNVSVFPKINTKSASLDLEKPKIKTDNLKYKAPKFTMPHFNLPQLKTPKADMHVSGDTSLPFSDFSLNTPKINGDLSAPDVDINLPKTDNKSFDLDVQTPNPDIDASSGKFWTNFRKKPKLHSPKAGLDLDANLNTPHVDPSLSKMEAPDFDINLPKAELDMQTPNIDVDAPSGKTNWLNWKWKNPKLQGPKADLDTDISVSDVLTPTIEGDINVPNTELNLPKADLSSPNVDFQAPDINAPSGKINWPHLKWKKNKLHGPKADMDLSADLSTPDVDLTAPKIDGALSTPDVDLNLPRADVDVKAPETGKLRFPTLKKGKFLLSGPKVKSSLIDVDAEAPDLNLSPKASLDGPDVDLNLPQADVKAPNVDIAGQSEKFKWTLKKPKGSVSNWSLKAPQINGEMKAPDLPRADLKGPELGIDTPDCDNSGKLKWFNLKKPKFGTPKGPKGDIDVDVKVPQMDLNGVDVNMSAPKIKTPKLNMADPHLGINGPDTNYDINLPKSNVVAPNVDLKATDLTLSAPKIDFNAPDLDINVPKADLKGPHIDLQTPGIDTPAGKLKLPKINLPGFGRKGLEVKGPNLNVDAENVNLPDVNLKLPKAAVKTPCLNPIKGDLCTPDLDLDAALNKNVDLSGPKTTISVPNINVPTLDTKGSHLNLNLPQADVTGPSFDLKAPDLSLSPQKFAAPKIDTKGPKTELEAPVTLKAPNMDINLPTADLKGPDTQLKTPDLNFDSHLGDFNFPHFKHPKFGLENPKVEVPSVSTAVENGIEAPKVNMVTPINTPELDITAEADAEVKGTPKSRIKWPFKWGLKSGTESNEEESGDESETVVSNADLEVPVFKMHKLPRNNLDGIGGTEDILSVSKLDSEAKDYIVSKGIRLPIVNPTTTAGEKIDIRQRLKMATEKSATANISTTEATRHTLNVNTSANTDSLVRGGTFKVDKPESIVGLVAPEISIPDERDKLSLSLSNMLGLNVKDSDAD